MLQPFDLAIAVLVVAAALGLLWWRLGMPGWRRRRNGQDAETKADPAA
jgi:hypothetical protein